MKSRSFNLAASLCAAALVGGCESYSLQPPSTSAIEADADDVVDRREIITLADSQSETTELLSLARARGYKLRRRDDLPSLGLSQLVLEIPAGRSSTGAIIELESLVSGVTAGVNHAYRMQTSAQGRRYAKDVMAWPASNCSLRQPVGLLDSAGGDVPEGVFVEAVTERPSTDVTHGTEIAALLLQTAPTDRAGVYIASVIGETGAAGVDDLIRGIAWLLQQDVRLINVSLAGPYNKLLDRTIQRASDRGALLVAAVGNEGPSAPPRYPAALDDVIAVTAVDAAIEPYTNGVRGPHVDVAAPGVDVFISFNGGIYRTGTSFAAPFVTAFFAARGMETPSAEQARRILQGASRDIGDPGHDPVFGLGILQADFSC